MSEPSAWGDPASIEVLTPSRSAITFLPYGILVTDLGNTSRFIPKKDIGYTAISEARWRDLYDG